MFHIIEEAQLDPRSTFYLVRSMLSSVNAQLIGIAANQVRKDARTPEDTSDQTQIGDNNTPTIDKANEYFTSLRADTSAPVGFDDPIDPKELTGNLLALRNKWLDIGHMFPATPEDVGDENIPSLEASIERTLEYMINRPMRELSDTMLQPVAVATGISVPEIRKAQEAQFHSDRAFLRNNKELIVDWIYSCGYEDSEGAYDRLPVRYQVRVLKKFEDYINKQRARAIQAVVARNIAAALGELTILNNVVSELTAYKNTRVKREGDFAEAYIAA